MTNKVEPRNEPQRNTGDVRVLLRLPKIGDSATPSSPTSPHASHDGKTPVATEPEAVDTATLDEVAAESTAGPVAEKSPPSETTAEHDDHASEKGVDSQASDETDNAQGAPNSRGARRNRHENAEGTGASRWKSLGIQVAVAVSLMGVLWLAYIAISGGGGEPEVETAESDLLTIEIPEISTGVPMPEKPAKQKARDQRNGNAKQANRESKSNTDEKPGRPRLGLVDDQATDGPNRKDSPKNPQGKASDIATTAEPTTGNTQTAFNSPANAESPTPDTQQANPAVSQTNGETSGEFVPWREQQQSSATGPAPTQEMVLYRHTPTGPNYSYPLSSPSTYRYPSYESAAATSAANVATLRGTIQPPPARVQR